MAIIMSLQWADAVSALVWMHQAKLMLHLKISLLRTHLLVLDALTPVGTLAH